MLRNHVDAVGKSITIKRSVSQTSLSDARGVVRGSTDSVPNKKKKNYILLLGYYNIIIVKR